MAGMLIFIQTDILHSDRKQESVHETYTNENWKSFKRCLQSLNNYSFTKTTLSTAHKQLYNAHTKPVNFEVKQVTKLNNI